MAEEKKETKKFFQMTKADIMKQENFMKSLNAAIEGMKAFEEKKANNMYQDVDNNVITRPVEIKLDKNGVFPKDEKDKSLTDYEAIDMVNAVNLMHTQLVSGNRENPIFLSEATMKEGFLKPKKGIEPTYTVGINHKTGEYFEKKMYHISDVEADQKRLDKANEGRSKKLTAVKLDDVVVKVPEHKRRYADALRKSIAYFVETEGKGALANLDSKKFADKVIGYSLQQHTEEDFMNYVSATIKKATSGMGKDVSAKFQQEYKKTLRDEIFAKDPETKKHIAKKEAAAKINGLAEQVKGNVAEKEAPKKEAPKKEAPAKKDKKAKKKEAPSR